MIRFFLKNNEIKNKTVMFDAEQSRKMRKVLRMGKGDKVITFDGTGWEYTVEMEKITNDFSVGKIVSQTLNENKTNICLYQAIPKNLKPEYILQKNTELGVDRFVFFSSDFAQIDVSMISTIKVKRWKKILQDASEQSGRIYLPELKLNSDTLSQIIDNVDIENSFYLDIDGQNILDLKEKINPININIFVGPEGGFSPNEKNLFEQKGIKKLKIADNILRSETASMIAIGQVWLLK
jgi:16S rRNA (uracil1498-N3)-methyltransferase